MKHPGQVQPAEEVLRRPEPGPAEYPIPVRSEDQDDFDVSFRAGVRSMGDLLRRRRKKA
jgi:hypothetical protein